MKISLKSFLLTVCVVGAIIGVMARLLIENPEMFLLVLQLGTTIGPFLLAVATIVWIGIRGAVRGRKLIVWGLLLLATPLLTQGALTVFWPTRNPLSVLSTNRLITRRLPVQTDEPWVWQELERRLAAGNLTQAEVEAAIGELTTYMKNNSTTGWNQPLSWQRTFLQSALQRGLVSDDARLSFSEAFYGTSPKVSVDTTTLHDQTTNIEIEIEYGTPWSNSSGLETYLVWDLKQVLLNGKAMPLREYRKHFGRSASMTVPGVTLSGNQTIAVQLDCAFVDAAQLAGRNPHDVTPEQCVNTLKRWTINVDTAVPTALNRN